MNLPDGLKMMSMAEFAAYYDMEGYILEEIFEFAAKPTQTSLPGYIFPCIALTLKQYMEGYILEENVLLSAMVRPKVHFHLELWIFWIFMDIFPYLSILCNDRRAETGWWLSLN